VGAERVVMHWCSILFKDGTASQKVGSTNHLGGLRVDEILVNYLRSGRAWVLVGSGPSTDMGYPSWAGLAAEALRLLRVEASPSNLPTAEAAFKKGNFPNVFDLVRSSLGTPRLLEGLRSVLKPSRQGRIYDALAEWPIPIYLTTNYDDELQQALARAREAYVVYSNSREHLALLDPDLSGAIYKLHGDLRSEDGLVLGAADYSALSNDERWSYWRTKLVAIFQLNPVIVVGHSITDRNIRAVLQAAQLGASVHQPVCWLAPDIPIEQSREYLEKFRIRVISYDNRDGTHQNLARLIDNFSQFTYPRAAIPIRAEIAAVTRASRGPSAAAPGFFVFARLSAQEDFHAIRTSAMCAAIQSVVPQLSRIGVFTLPEALHVAGWPEEATVSAAFEKDIAAAALRQGLVVVEADKYRIAPDAKEMAADASARYTHTRTRWKQSLALRIRNNYPAFTQQDAESLSDDIEASLVAFFREAGLTLATTLLSGPRRPKAIPVPSSILRFISQAAAQYPDSLRRQAFSTVAVDIFAQAEDPDREFLGRVSQGFFAFHALGLLGDAAVERLSRARDTVWIIDSSAQIPALALAAPTHALFRDTFLRLNAMGVRLFTTEKLFRESASHFWFADNVIANNGPDSPLVLAAAVGQPPFKKANQFLEGFVRWRGAGNPSSWEAYLDAALDAGKPTVDELRATLCRVGIEVVSLDRWPGFSPSDINECSGRRDAIVERWEARLPPEFGDDPELMADIYEKADPEAEACVAVTKERDGTYHILASPGTNSPAWFVSQTSMLNLLQPGSPITWQPEAFIRFATTLAPSTDPQSANRAFEILLMAFTQVGATLVDDKTLKAAFGGVIDAASLSIDTVAAEYEEVLAWKYGESAQAVLERLPLASRAMGAIQLANEIALAQSDKAKAAQARAEFEAQRAEAAQSKLARLDRVERSIKEKRRKAEEKARKRKTSQPRKGRRARTRKK